MSDAVTAVSAVELTIGGGCLAIAWLASRYRSRPAGTPLLGLALAAAGWAIAAGVASLVADPTVTRVAQFATYVLGGVAAVAWFHAVLEYTAYDRWRPRAVRAATAALVGVDLLSVATNPWHHRYVTSASAVGPGGLFDPVPGTLLWLNAAWKVGVVLVGIAVLVRAYDGQRGLLTLQTTSLVVAGIVAPGAAFAELLDVVGVPGLDFGVVGVAASAAVLVWALVYADLLSVAPIAHRTLFDQLDDAVVALDAAGNVVEMNSRAMALFDAGSEAIGRPAASVLAAVPGLGDGEPPDGEAFVTEVDGRRRHYELTTSPVRAPAAGPGEDGDRIGQLVVLRDVTSRRERERDVERKNARLEEFASVVSHDLRNPLSVARGYLDLARETGDEADFDEVVAAHDRMDALIEDLLVLAREGQSVQDTEPVDLAALVGNCWRNVSTGDATLDVATTRTLRADQSRLAQLLENLLRNAVEHGSTDPRSHAPEDAVEHGSTNPDSHAPEDAVEHGSTNPDSHAPEDAVEHHGVTVTVGDCNGGFFVADDGPGIPEEARETAFEYGYSTNPDGTGLGLAIVREIAEAHGWSVRVTESEGGGARFEFTGVESAA